MIDYLSVDFVINNTAVSDIGAAPMLRRNVWYLVGCLVFVCAISDARADGFVAGLTPWERPAGAPVIKSVDRDPEWFRHALTGISRPYPTSLRFLDDQGNWHTPFDRPGMTGPYDIRGWHQPASHTGPE